MIRNRIGRVVRVTIPVVLLVVVTSVVTLSAQGNPTLNEILAKLDEIIAVLTPTPPDPPDPPGPVTLATSAVRTAGQNIYCTAANLGTETVIVEIKAINQFGSVVAGPYFLNALPGVTLTVFHNGAEDILRCEFTVAATAAIRANLIAVSVISDQITAIAEAR